MLNLNRVEVIGNLTRDPELRYTPGGQAVASFAIATNRRWRDDNNNWVDSPPEYHEVVIWAKLAEGASRVLKKGVRVYAAGRLQTRSWDAPDGTKRYKTELVADTLIGPDQVSKAAYSGQEGGPVVTSSKPEPTSPEGSPVQKETPKKLDTPEDEIDIEDIPF